MPGTAPPRLQRYFALAAGSLRRAGRFGLAERQLMLLPYLGYGNAQRLWLHGRVLAERPFREQLESDSSWRNAAGLYRRLESDEVAGSAVLASFGGQSWRAVTDGGGYFAFEIDLAEPPPPGWLSVTLTLPDSEPALSAEAAVLVPDAGARFGIISDLDDTVIQTNVINKLNMAWTLLRSNQYTRQPFPAWRRCTRRCMVASIPCFMSRAAPGTCMMRCAPCCACAACRKGPCCCARWASSTCSTLVRRATRSWTGSTPCSAPMRHWPLC